ncbi:MAG: Gfo/Idh/MocA family oxidoreductase [Pelolinea sp.]|nr:Gfo/Idh/MocA family oxidoreductase [Pelolinea sp.]
MKLVVIGTGGIAQKAYFPLLAVMPDVEIIGIHSHTQAHVDKACQRWGYSFGTTNLEEIVALKPKAALVISNTESHYAICREMLENGIDVYSEKSLTTSSEQTLDLARFADEHKRVLAVGFNRRYALLYKQAKEILGNRKINLAVIQKHRTEASNPTLYEQYLDDTIHQIDLMRFYCGDVNPLKTVFEKKNHMVTSAISTVEIPGGGHGVIMICNHAGSWQESVTLHTEGVSIHVDAFQRLRVISDDHEEIYGTDRAGKWITGMKERGFYGELAHFFNCVQTRGEPFTNAHEAAKTQQLLEGLILAAGEKIIP